jgi:polyisoprenoid-binding protein YceI
MSISRTSLLVVPAVLWIALVGCSNPTEGKPHATVLSAAPSAAPPPPVPASAAPETKPAALGNLTLDVDPAQSKLGFIGSKKTMSHPGEFTKYKASITLADGKPEGGKIAVEIDMDSVKTDQEKLDTHLKSDDFFDTKKYPTASFVSTEIRTGGAWENSHTVVGDLTLHGVTKKIEFPATIKVENGVVIGKADFAINRKDWKINYKGKLDDLIREDVLIKFDLKAPVKKG